MKLSTNSDELTFISLFAGIGGFDLGFERAGLVCKAQVEIDEFCIKVLEKHWSNVMRFQDVRQCGKHNLPAVDLICGGFPCQDISEANQSGTGIDGERSGLWREFGRIICELQPRWVVIENVRELLRKNDGGDISAILWQLSNMGYHAEWATIPAFAVGSPQYRHRLFIVAYSSKVYKQTLGIFDRTALQTFSETKGKGQWSSMYCRTNGGRTRKLPNATIYRVANGIPSELDRSRIGALGNAVVPQIAEWIGERIKAIQELRNRV